MKTTFIHNHKHNIVEIRQPITDNVTYIHNVTYGYKSQGLQTVITGFTDGIWLVSIHSYAETMGEALNKLQTERLKKASPNSEMWQASTALWK